MEQDLGMRVWRLMSHHVDELRVPRFWEYCRQGYIALGWDTGDCRELRPCGRRKIYDFLKSHWERLVTHNEWFGACSVWGFYHEMQAGDVILLKSGQGPNAVLQVDEEHGEYYYDPQPNPGAGRDFNHYPHRRRVVSLNYPGPNELMKRYGGLDLLWLRQDAPEDQFDYIEDYGVHCALLPCKNHIFRVEK